MKNKFEEFLKLHNNAEPLLLGNVWNVESAKVFEQKKLKAIATSSQAVAETLGYPDGQEMTLDEYLFIIKRIAASVSIPFSVDMEGGYGNTVEQICANLAQLYYIGVSGVNIEDSVIVDGKRSIVSPVVFAEKLKLIVERLRTDDIRLFINVRSDSFLLDLPDALNDALSRIDLYQNTGVNGLFFPCITKIADIEQVAKRSKLPVNVMCMPNLPDFKQLQHAGIKRISVGPFLKNDIYQKLETSVDRIIAEGSFDSLFK